MSRSLLTLISFSLLSKISATIVITEIMDDPSLVSDINGEWFEIYNNSASNIELQNYSFTDGGNDSFTITSSLIIEPMSYLIFGCNDNESINGGYNPDYVYSRSEFKLDNGSDEIYLYNNTGQEIDMIAYNANFPASSGFSKELINFFANNNQNTNWMLSEIAYGIGDYGTPGAENSVNTSIVTIDPDTTHFYQVDISNPSSSSIQIINSLSSLLEITGVVANNPDLTFNDTYAQVTYGESHTASITWAPSAVGEMFDTLYVLSNEDTVAHGFAKGTAVSVSPQASLNTYSIFFNGVLPNETTSEMVTISNSSELASLSIEQITSNNDAFYVTDHSVNVGPLSSYDLEIFFTPNQIGLQSGELTLATSDFYNHHITIELRGLGSSQNQNIIIETDSLVFLGSIAGVSNTKSFTIYNGGINELNIEDIFVSPPFSVNPSYGIVPGVSDQGIINSIIIDVICEASTSTNSNISIYSDDPDSPEYIIPVSFRLNEEFAFVNDLTVPMSQDFGSSSGTAIADLNNDGLLDMLVANRAGTKNKYYLQQQDLTFLSYELNPNVENDSENFTVADIHNDGRMTIVQTDLLNESTTLMHSVSCHFMIDQFNEDGQIDYNDDGSIPYIPDNIYSPPGDFSTYNQITSSFYDFNRDGRLDLFAGGTNSLLFLNLTTINDFLPVWDDSIFAQELIGPYVISGTWADYNNDGAGDLLLVGNNSDLWFYKGNPDGSLTQLENNLGIQGGSQTYAGASWGDYDNDGDQDVVITNIGDGDNFTNSILYRNDIDNFTPVYEFPSAFGSSWGDLNNDGLLDLVTTASFTGGAFSPNGSYIHLNIGNNQFESYPLPDGDSRGVSLGDIDNDGDLDIFIANRSDQNNFVLRNLGNDNHWINITCIDTIGNRSAIGTKVRAKATIFGDPVWQMQEISGQTGGGFGGQNSLNVEFGLGDAVSIDSLIFEWSLGQRDTLVNIPVDTFIVYTSGQLFGDMEPPMEIIHTSLPTEFVLHQNFPNPFNPTTTLRYEVPVNGRVQIQVYDILGNHVINLVDKYHDSGSWSAIWNGTNKDGQSVAAGIYVYTINAHEVTHRKKMILLK